MAIKLAYKQVHLSLGPLVWLLAASWGQTGPCVPIELEEQARPDGLSWSCSLDAEPSQCPLTTPSVGKGKHLFVYEVIAFVVSVQHLYQPFYSVIILDS